MKTPTVLRPLIFLAFFISFLSVRGAENVPANDGNTEDADYDDHDHRHPPNVRYGEGDRIDVTAEKGDPLMHMQVSQLLQILKLDPAALMHAASQGELNTLEKLKLFVQDKLLGIVSVPCYADMVYFTQKLYDYGRSAYRLSKECLRYTTGAVRCDCVEETERDMESNAWTLSVLDATGKGSSGVFEGNFWLGGNFDQCINLKRSKDIEGQTWEGKYCRIQASLYQNTTCSTTYIFNWDTCFPASCTKYDLHALVNTTLSHVMTSGKLICDYKVMSREKRAPFTGDWAAVLISAIIILAGALMLQGTLYDYYSYLPVVKTLPDTRNASTPENVVTKKQYFERQSWFVKMLLAFSVYSNGPKIFDTAQRPGQIHCLHGVRFMSMAWIIFGHTYYWSKNYINNLAQAYTLPPIFLNQMLLNGSLGVDAFYTIAAMLLTYLWSKEMKKHDRVKSPQMWFMFYFHRYVRLTPLYAMILAIDATLIKYAGDGPMWNPDGIEVNACRKSWWTNLLYVNNFVHLDEPCMTWSWYLANDMQFYVFSPIFLVLLWWKEVVGIVSLLVTILVTGIIRAAIIMSNENWPPISIFSIDEKQFNIVEPYWKEVYVKPYCRCGAWLVGMLLGYGLYKCQLKVDIPKWAAHLGWLLAAALGVGIVFGLYNFSNTSYMSPVGLAIYGGFGRTLWAVALSWVIFASATGYGGPVGVLLSWKIFIPLSKLVYAAYLLHPVVLMVYYSSQPRPFHYSGHYHYVCYFLTHLIVSFAIAAVISLAFEVPIQGLEKIIFGSHDEQSAKRGKPKPAQQGSAPQPMTDTIETTIVKNDI